MKIVRNKLIPFGGYKYVNLFGVLFVKSTATLDEKSVTHETIHTCQMKWMLYLFFYLWYAVEWLVRLAQYRNAHDAYHNIAFEREAYANQLDAGYPESRRRYAWVKYLKL